MLLLKLLIVLYYIHKLCYLRIQLNNTVGIFEVFELYILTYI